MADDPNVEPNAEPNVEPAAPPGDGGSDSKPVVNDWPDDWQAKLAGDDEKALKQLERFNSPDAVFKSYRSMVAKMDAGELKAPLAEDASEEEIATWRKENGIPETPEGYAENLPEGVVLGESDRAVFDEVAKTAHEMNVPPTALHALTKVMLEKNEEAIAADREFQLQAMQAAEDELRPEFGNDYRRQMNRLKSFLDTLPESIREDMINARLGDEKGTPLWSSPDVIKHFLNQYNAMNPAASVVPGSQNPSQAIGDEIATIEKFMRTNRKEYNRDTKMQARYLELIEARDKLQAA